VLLLFRRYAVKTVACVGCIFSQRRRPQESHWRCFWRYVRQDQGLHVLCLHVLCLCLCSQAALCCPSSAPHPQREVESVAFEHRQRILREEVRVLQGSSRHERGPGNCLGIRSSICNFLPQTHAILNSRCIQVNVCWHAFLCKRDSVCTHPSVGRHKGCMAPVAGSFVRKQPLSTPSCARKTCWCALLLPVARTHRQLCCCWAGC